MQRDSDLTVDREDDIAPVRRNFGGPAGGPQPQCVAVVLGARAVASLFFGIELDETVVTGSYRAISTDLKNGRQVAVSDTGGKDRA